MPPKRAGKYARFVGVLPDARQVIPEDHQAKISRVKEIILSEVPHQATSYAQLHLYARLRKERLKVLIKEMNLEIEAINQLLIDQYEVEDVTMIKLETGTSIGTQVEPYAQVVNRDLFREWCIANGLERSLMLPWQTT